MKAGPPGLSDEKIPETALPEGKVKIPRSGEKNAYEIHVTP